MTSAFIPRKITSLLTALFGVSFILLLFLIFVVYQHLSSLKNYNQQAVHAYTVINQIKQAESFLKDAENGTRAFLITKDSAFLQPIFSIHRQLLPALDSLGKLFDDKSIQKEDYEHAVQIALLQLRTSDSLIKTSLENNTHKDSIVNALMLRSKTITNSYKAVTQHMMNIETDQLVYRRKQIGYYQLKLFKNFTQLFITVLIIIMALAIWVFIELKKRILYQTTLEGNIIRLNQNNAELEQIAFAASHDLQEPLRKIRIFSDRLQQVTKNKLDKEADLIVNRIHNSAKQLHGLILDLVDLTNIVQSEIQFQPVNLKAIIEACALQFKYEIENCNCKIITGDLPVINGSAELVTRLFINLFSNSFAFKSAERSLVIIISAEKIKSTHIKGLPKQSSYKEYFHLKFQDNGIGFNNAFKEKLFMPFQRLHNYGNDELRRKGMGLAICKRIIVNHKGWIDADGNENKGTIIHLYFPTIV